MKPICAAGMISVMVELERAKALQLGRLVLGRIEPDFLELRVGVVPVVRVAHDLDVRLHDPVVEHERAVADEVAGPRPLIAVRLERRAVDGIGHRVREQAAGNTASGSRA